LLQWREKIELTYKLKKNDKEIIEKLISKHTLNLGKCKTLEDCAKAENNFTNELLKAINYSHCCKSDSELLPKRLSNEAYNKAQVMTYDGFVQWWDEQQV